MSNSTGGYFTKFKGRDGHYYFNLKAPNHEIILKSEGYQNSSGRDNGIASVEEHSPHDKYYQRLVSSNGQFYFNLKASNGQKIGTSELYTTSYSRDQGIENVKRYAPSAIVKEAVSS